MCKRNPVNSIAMKANDGKIHTIHGHCGVVRALKAHYKTQNQVDTLVDIGRTVLKLGKTVEETRFDFFEHKPIFRDITHWKECGKHHYDSLFLFNDGKWEIYNKDQNKKWMLV